MPGLDKGDTVLSYSYLGDDVFTGYASGPNVLLRVESAPRAEWLSMCTTAIRSAPGAVYVKLGERTIQLPPSFVDLIKEGKLTTEDILIK